jgi:carbon-monoxide dehydrogenase medium subunit
MRNFEYLQPNDLDEAIGALQEHAGEAKLMAGGQSLVLLLREGLVQPEVVISLMRVPDLDFIRLDQAQGMVEIGALATHRQVEQSPLIQQQFPFVREAYQTLGSVSVRNLATLGGNLCHNAPGSDPPPLLIALGAQVRLRGPTGERKLPLEEFGTGYFETALGEAELLHSVEVPVLPLRSGVDYKKYAVRPMDMAIVGVAARITVDGDTCQQARIALGGVGPTTLRAHQAESALRGQTLSEAVLDEAAELALAATDPISDVHASESYRRRLTPAAVRRSVRAAWQQALAA